MFADATTEDFFRARLDHMIDLRHSLAVLASRMPWQQIEASVAHLFSRKAHAEQAMPDLDLFGEAPAPLVGIPDQRDQGFRSERDRFWWSPE